MIKKNIKHHSSECRGSSKPMQVKEMLRNTLNTHSQSAHLIFYQNKQFNFKKLIK